MSNHNYGKKFEDIIKDSFSLLDVDVQRLYDTTNGFTGIKQPSDFIIYKYPYQYYVECKCTWDNTFHQSKIPQLMELAKKSLINGVVAGAMIWFIKHDTTVFIPVETLVKHYYNNSSVNIKQIQNNTLSEAGKYFTIQGQKKRIFFEYDMIKFFEEVENWMRTK